MKLKLGLLIAAVSLLLGSAVTYLFIHTNVIKEKAASVSQEIPECNSYRCPEYYSFSVDGDYKNDESEVIVPTAMTQGAGKLLIIKKGKVIFQSPEMMQIGVRETGTGNGFVLTYSDEVNSSDKLKEIRYLYKNGSFVQVKSNPAPNTIDAAVELIKKDGYTIYDPSKNTSLNLSPFAVLIGTCTGSADGHCQKPFFFYNWKPVGTDEAFAGTDIMVKWTTEDTIAVEYTLYRKDDPLCCSTLGASIVRFHWDGKKVAPLDPIPAYMGQ